MVDVDEAQVLAYEEQRNKRIKAAREKLKELAVEAAADQLTATHRSAIAAPKRRKAAKRSAESEEVDPAILRRSTRENKTVSYKEEDFFPRLPGGALGGTRGPKREVNDDEVEKLRKEHGITVNEDGTVVEAKKSGRGNVDSGKGVRVQGGRVYDSKFGVTCHWCRQKTLEDHVTCSNDNCGKQGKVARLPTSFCKMCLRNRHGEDCTAAAISGSWLCPQCRGSCGEGCVSCCNCGPCRKKLQLEPTHQVVKLAKQAGFSNVHDYLIHIVTGEDQATVSARKQKFSWGQWLTDSNHAAATAAALEDTADTAGTGAAAVAAGHGSAAPASNEVKPAGGTGNKRKAAKKSNTAAAAAAEDPTTDGIAKEAAATNKNKRAKPALDAETAKAGKPSGAADRFNKHKKAAGYLTTAVESDANSQDGKDSQEVAVGKEALTQSAEANPEAGQRNTCAETEATGRQAIQGTVTVQGDGIGSRSVEAPELTGYTLTRKQKKQLEMGLVSVKDLLVQLQKS